jgi:HlyD family secretion protein
MGASGSNFAIACSHSHLIGYNYTVNDVQNWMDMFRKTGMFFLIALLTACKPQTHQYQGYVEGENLYLSSPYSGRLIHSWVQRGAHVKKGQKLFKLDDNPQILMIKETVSSLNQAKQMFIDLSKPKRKPETEGILAQIAQTDAQITLAKLRYQRNQVLYAKHATDLDSVDAAKEHWLETIELKAQYLANLDLAKLGARENQVNAQKAAMQSIMAKLKQNKWQLSQKTVYAPGNGIIFDTLYYQGEFVPEAKPVMVFLPPKHMRIEFFVPVTQLSFLHLNDRVQFSCDSCNKNDQNEATISYISPTVEYSPPLIYSRENSDKLVFRVKALLKHPWRYHPGMPVVVTVTEHG